MMYSTSSRPSIPYTRKKNASSSARRLARRSGSQGERILAAIV